MNKRYSSTILAGAMYGSCTLLPVYADDLSKDVITMDVISVSAKKIATSTFDTADSISVVDSEAIDQIQPQSLSDVLKDVAGVSFTGGPRSVAEKPVIRGLSGNRILITVDGVRQNFNSGHKGRVFIEPDLLKSVEVLKGAGSSIWGSGAMGGVIAMTTKDAEDFIQGDEVIGVRLKSGYQSNNNDALANGILFGTLPFSSEVSYLLSGTYREADDIAAAGGKELENSAEESWANLSKVNWYVTDNSTIKLSRQYNLDTAEVPAQADFLAAATNVLTDRETEVESWRLSYDYEPDYSDVTAGFFIYDNSQLIREKRISTDGRLDTIDYNTRGIDTKMLINIDSNFVSQSIITGIEYYQDKQKSDKGNLPNFSFPDATADFFGAYFQTDIDIGDFILSPGVRFDSYKSNTDNEGLDVDSIDEEKLSPKLSLVYKISDKARFFINYAEAFRAPNFQELYISGVHFGLNEFRPPEEVLDPELAENKEIGFRYSLSNFMLNKDEVRFDMSYYHNDYQDFIETFVTDTVTSFRNVSEAEITGFEFSGQYSIRPSGLDFSLTYAQSKGTDVTDGSNDPLSSIPGYLTNIKISKQLNDIDLMFGLRGTFSQTQNRTSEGQSATKAYNLYDFFLAWYPDIYSKYDLRIDFGIDNMADERYRKHLSNLDEMGRNYKVSASFQF